MLNTTFILQAVINGVLIGGVYSLVAVGLNLIFGVMRIINFAHGALMMMGMYIAYWSAVILHINPYVSLLGVIPCLFLLGAVVQRGLITPIIDAPEHNQLLLTLGVSLFLENLALFLWSPDYRMVPMPLNNINWYVGDITISLVRVLAFSVSLLCSGILFVVLTKTDLGKAIRAASDERDGAILMGINVNKIYMIAFGIGSACAGVAGATITPFFPVYPQVGGLFVITAFVVVVLGGMGSFVGAFAGGLIIGVAESIGAIFLPGSMKAIVSFSIFILILLFKPAGLFGGRRG
jgi:branched-chain amino acid transport system permease protein